VVVFSGLLPNDWLALLQPDVHCKSADYKADSLPEAGIVRQHGGRVEILPLEPGYSTSDLLWRVAAAVEADRPKSPAASAVAAKSADPVADLLRVMLQSANEHRQLAYRLAPRIVAAAEAIAAAVRKGRRVLLLCDDACPWMAEAIDLLLRPRLGDALELCPAGGFAAESGDVLLAACTDPTVSTFAATAGHSLGVTAIVIAPAADAAPRAAEEGANRIALPVEAADLAAAQILQLAVARAIASLLPRLAPGAAT
jgi:hypothetical protein